MPAGSQLQIQQSERPPAQPSYILRGHKAQVHALHFLRGNSRLLSGDADGFVILWDITSRRPKAVWKAHAGGILGIVTWSDSKVLTHGRDGKVKVWRLDESVEDGLDTELPVQVDLKGGTGEWKNPWMLHVLQVHTLNFCAFASHAVGEKLLIATPAANEGATIVHDLPSGDATHLVPPAEAGKTGMVMALRMCFVDGILHVVTGYESGLTSVQRLKLESKVAWETIASCKPHTQPILSLDLVISASIYLTSSADAVIAKCSLGATTEHEALTVLKTGHSGQQSLCVRDDGKIFATAGWDARLRIYSVKSMKEVAVLKWHGEGCYATVFADVVNPDVTETKLEGPDHTVSAKNRHQGEADQALVADTSRSKLQTSNLAVRSSEISLSTVRQQREAKARQTHWLAAGSKDGKISLWEVF